MIESKVAFLEERIEELASQDKALHNRLKDLQIVVNNLIETSTLNSAPNPISSTEPKVKYLTEANEQMFQQNVRLRQFIETCIEKEIIPSHRDYYNALRGDN